MKKTILLFVIIFYPSYLTAQEIPISTPLISDTLQISEIYPYPTPSELEWIEIYNYGDQEVNLNNYYLLDKGTSGNEFGKTKSFLGNIKVKPKEYLIFENLKISLNNAGDTITLFNADNKILDSVFYESSESGESFGRKFSLDKLIPVYTDVSQKLTLTSSVTKKEQNYFIELTESSILEIKNKPNETFVMVKGTVISEMGSFGEKIFYIQDSSGGIRIELLEDTNAEINIGQLIQIKGTRSSKNNEVQITVEKLEDILFLGNDIFDFYTSLDPVDINTGNIYKIEAIISKQSTGGFYIYQGDSEIKVTLVPELHIDDSKLKKNDKIILTGILSKFNTAFRILPRSQSDIEVLSSIILPNNEAEIEGSSDKILRNSQIEYNMPVGEIYKSDSAKFLKKVYLWPFVLFNLVLLILVLMLTNKEKATRYLKKFQSLLYNRRVVAETGEVLNRYKIILEDDKAVR